MKTSALLAALTAFLIVPGRVDAQQMTLHIQNGLVSLDAQNVSIRQILAEWARIGGARIVNGEKVMGGPVTLQLNAVPERQALDTILRGVSGYMLASREAGSSGASAFDRILILPTSSAPRSNTPPPNAAFAPRPMPAQPPEPVETEVVEDDDHDEPEAGDPDVAAEGGEEEVVQPQPGVNPRFQRRPAFPNPMGVQGQPFGPQTVYPGTQPMQNDEDPAAGQPTTRPFNVPPGASATPGVIAPVPQQDPQQPPQQRPRRPPL
jgi:hypothetical protein